MKRAVRWMTLAVLVASLTMLTGCWNYQEVENRYIVSGLAIDRGQQGYRYHLTFEVLDISGGGQGGQMKGKVIKTDGNTIADAVDNASKISDKNLFYSDCKVVIFSKQIAQEGLTQVLDWFNRDPKPRFTVQMFVSNEKTAGELFEAGQQGGQQGGGQGGGQGDGQEGGQGGGQGGVISTQISNSMEAVSTGGKSKQMHLYDVDNVLLGEGKALTLPCLQKSNQKNPPVEVKGTAVFNGDKYAGFLEDEQTRYFLFMNGVQNTTLLVGEDSSNKNIALQVIRNEVSVTPQIDGDKISMKVKVKMECGFDEENSQQNYLLQNGVKGIEAFANKTLKEDIGGEIRRVQKQLGCDIFGFGRRIYQEKPKEWKKLKSSWQEKFPTVSVEVEPDVTIINTEFTRPKGIT